jgi:3-oxoadipate enol-lactonase
MFVRDSGASSARPTIVLLHGLGVSAELNWFTSIPALSRHFRVVAPDLPGHGRSPKTRHQFTLEGAADDVAALARAVSLGPFIAVGYSMGGAIAQLLWQRHRDQVRALVLCATSRSFRGTMQERLLFAALPPVRATSRVIPHTVTRAATRFLGDTFVGEQFMPGFADQLDRFDVRHVLDAAASLGGYRSHGWIDQVDVATSVLVHMRDQLVPPRRQLALAHAIPGADVHTVDADHFAPVRNPEAFVPTLVAAAHRVNRRTSRHSPAALAG